MILLCCCCGWSSDRLIACIDNRLQIGLELVQLCSHIGWLGILGCVTAEPGCEVSKALLPLGVTRVGRLMMRRIAVVKAGLDDIPVCYALVLVCLILE